MTYHTTPEYNRNWVSFAHGSIKDFAPSSLEREHFYSKVSAAVKTWPGAGPCACTFFILFIFYFYYFATHNELQAE